MPVAELRSPDGRCTPIPDEVDEVLGEVVEALSRGQAVTVAAHDQTFTTQEAADLLGIRRPTLVKISEDADLYRDDVTTTRLRR